MKVLWVQNLQMFFLGGDGLACGSFVAAIFHRNLDTWNLKTRFSYGMYCNFSQGWCSAAIRLILRVFQVSLGTIFMIFGAMGAGLKFHGLCELPVGTHELM